MKSEKKRDNNKKVEAPASLQYNKNEDQKDQLPPWKMENLGLRESKCKIFKDLLKKSFSRR